MNVWIIHIVLPPTALPPFLTLINNSSSSFVKHVSEWFFAPWERNLSWPRFLSCYCAAGETADANDRLDPQSVRHSTIFLCWLKHFLYPPPSKSWLWSTWVSRLLFFFRDEKTGPKSNSNEGFYSIAVKCKITCFSSLENCVSSWWERWYLLNVSVKEIFLDTCPPHSMEVISILFFI